MQVAIAADGEGVKTLVGRGAGRFALFRGWRALAAHALIYCPLASPSRRPPQRRPSYRYRRAAFALFGFPSSRPGQPADDAASPGPDRRAVLSMMEIDSAGHRFRRAGRRKGFPGQSLRWRGVRNCPSMPPSPCRARSLREAVEMPGGRGVPALARTLEGPQGAFNERPRRTAILIGCDIGFRDEVGLCRPALPAGSAPDPGRPRPAALLRARRLLARAEPPHHKAARAGRDW